MTALIKFNTAAVHGKVRAVVFSRPAVEPEVAPVDPEKVALESTVTALKAREAELEASLAQAMERHDDAFERGRQEGYAAGLAVGEARAAQSLILLEAAASAAMDLFAREIASLERLAPAVAHEALRKVIGEASAAKAHLDAVVRQQLKVIDAQALVRIEVSCEDFPDAAELAALSARLASPALTIVALEDLSAGACRIRLKLGALEVGVNQQWGRLSASLLQLSEPEQGL